MTTVIHRNRFVHATLFIVGLILIIKFIFALGEHPTSNFIVATLFLVAVSFGNVRHLVLLPEISTADAEIFEIILNRLFKITLICLFICLVAVIIYPSTGIFTTILVWVMGHTAIAVIKGGLACATLVGRLAKG